MKTNVLIVGSLACLLAGCNIGNAPAPMSESDLKTAIDKLPPKDEIDYINSSPMPPAMKAQRIKEIEDRTGYKAPESKVPKTGQ